MRLASYCETFIQLEDVVELNTCPGVPPLRHVSVSVWNLRLKHFLKILSEGHLSSKPEISSLMLIMIHLIQNASYPCSSRMISFICPYLILCWLCAMETPGPLGLHLSTLQHIRPAYSL